MKTTRERTPTQKQLYAMRVKLGRMLDECREVCEFATQQNVRECKTCEHGERLRALGRKIEEMQRIDREERGVKRWSDSVMPGTNNADIQVKHPRKTEIGRRKNVELPRGHFRFSKRHATFEEWLNHQKRPYSKYVRAIIELHEKHPTATRDELVEVILEKRIERKRQREMKGEGQHGKIPS